MANFSQQQEMGHEVAGRNPASGVLVPASVDGHVLLGNVFETVPCIARHRTPLTQPRALSVDQGCVHLDTCIVDVDRSQCKFTTVGRELPDNVTNRFRGRSRCSTTTSQLVIASLFVIVRVIVPFMSFQVHLSCL